MQKVCFSASTRCSSVLFLTGKKRTKRSRHRGGAEAKSIDIASVVQHFYPDSEPPSPMYPTRPGRRIFPYRVKNDDCQAGDKGRERGLGGGWLKGGVLCQITTALSIGFASTPPPSRFLLVLFLSGTRKVHYLSFAFRKVYFKE